MEGTSVQIPKDMIDDLDALAKERLTKRSQIIRIAIKEHLDRAKKAGEI